MVLTQLLAAYDYSPFGVTRLSFEPNYTPGSAGGDPHPLKPDFMWCLDGNGTEKYGSGHDATPYNMTTTADRNNQSGKALESAGNVNSYMEIAHHADLVFEDNDFTVGIWVKRLALNNNWNHTVAAGKWHSGQEPTQNEWYLAISNGGSGNHPPQFAIQAGSTKYTAGGTAVPVGDWYHLVGVREGENIKLYVDGVLVDTEYVGAAVVNTIPSRNIFLGLMGNGKFLKAGFDEFVVYHRALSAAEVGDLYEMGCGDFDTESGVLAEVGCRYGFNGMEKDDEVKGKGNHIDFGARGYDPRLGRWLSVDPLFMKYPYASGYSAMTNSPISIVDIDGRDNIIYLVVLPSTRSKMSNADYKKIVDLANQRLSDLGIKTEVRLFDPSINGEFDARYIDNNDTFVLLGKVPEIKNMVGDVGDDAVAREGFSDAIIAARGWNGGKSNPEESKRGFYKLGTSGSKLGQGILIDSNGADRFSTEFLGISKEDGLALIILHGATHNVGGPGIHPEDGLNLSATATQRVIKNKGLDELYSFGRNEGHVKKFGTNMGANFPKDNYLKNRENSEDFVGPPNPNE